MTPLMFYPIEYPSSEQANRNTLENALKSNASGSGGVYMLPAI